LMPKPPVFKPFEIIFENEEDIVEIVEVLRPLRIRGIIPNSAVIANILWEAGSGNVRRSDYITEPGHTPDEIQKQIQKDTGMGAWNLYAALYGTQEQVDVNWKIIVDEFKKLGKGRIVTQEEAGDKQPFKYRAELMSGVPNLQEFGLYNWRGGGGSMWFRSDTGMGAWNLYAALYGTQEQVDVNWKIIVDEFKKRGKGRIVTQEEAGDKQPFKYRAELMSGVPNLQEFGLYNWRGGGGSMWF